MDYYVYIYLNPLKPGYYYYDDISFTFEPFYVGKGSTKWDRKKYHIAEAKRYAEGKIKNVDKLNLHKLNTILQIKNKLKCEPIIIEIFQTDKEEEASSKEIEIIDKIGREDLNKGPLVNMTNGGESVGSYWLGKKREPFTDEHRKHLGESLKGNKPWCKGKKLYTETKEKIRIKQTGKKYSKEVNKKKARFDTEHPRTVLYEIINPQGISYIVLGDKGIRKICLEYNLNYNSIRTGSSIRFCKGKYKGWVTKKLGTYKEIKQHYGNIDFR